MAAIWTSSSSSEFTVCPVSTRTYNSRDTNLLQVLESCCSRYCTGPPCSQPPQEIPWPCICPVCHRTGDFSLKNTKPRLLSEEPGVLEQAPDWDHQEPPQFSKYSPISDRRLAKNLRGVRNHLRHKVLILVYLLKHLWICWFSNPNLPALLWEGPCGKQRWQKQLRQSCRVSTTILRSAPKRNHVTDWHQTLSLK